MGASAKAPKTPDYTGAAVQQGQNDMKIAQYLTQANRPNQVDPYGQTTWSQTPDAAAQEKVRLAQIQYDQYANDPRYQNSKEALAQRAKFKSDLDQAQSDLKAGGQWTQTTTLTPEQQKLLNQQQFIGSMQNDRIAGLIRDFQTPQMAAQRQLAPERQLKDVNQNDIQNLLYGQITKQYDDRFARDEAAQRAQLANQGFQMGSEGYNNTLNDFTKDKNSAYGDAATQAALASYDQMNTERGQNLNEFNALSTNDLNRYGAQTNDDMSRYTTQMNYLTQLLGGVQGPTTPQYQPFAQATPYQSPDLLGAMQGKYQGDLNKTNASNASKSQNMQTVGTIASAAAIAF